MKRIEINGLEDLQKLETLSGKETIFVKINNERILFNIEAIDLSKFKGRIILSFLKDPIVIKTNIRTDSNKNQYFFKNTEAQIEMPYRCQCLIHYIKIPLIKEVSNEEEFQEAIDLYFKGTIIKIKFIKDFGIQNNLNIPNVPIISNGHTIFTSNQKVQKQLKQKNIICMPHDKIIKINKAEDFKKITELNGNIYMEIQQDIENQFFSAVSLENFKGYLLINGNGHYIKNCKIKNEVPYGGLISKINKQGSMSIIDLHLYNVSFIGSCLYSGGFLGERMSDTQPVAFYPQPVKFIKCSVKSCSFENNRYGVGAFVGKGTIGTEIYNCSFNQNYTNGKPVIYSIGNEFFGMAISPVILDPNSLQEELSLVMKKKF